jgi:hypothetical protein
MRALEECLYIYGGTVNFRSFLNTRHANELVFYVFWHPCDDERPSSLRQHVANDAALTELEIDLDVLDDADLKLILDAAKTNKTVKKLIVTDSGQGRPMGVPVALSLASVVSEHPEIQGIEFYDVSFIEFGPIALAIRQNHKLTGLLLHECRGSPNLVECFRWLLTENALESMTLQTNSFSDGDPPFDIYGALSGNSSLKKLVLHDEYGVFCSETFQAIPHMIRTNQDFETLDLSLSETITDRFELVRLVTQAAKGHASLNKLAIAYFGDSHDEPPSAQVLINHGGTAEAVGMMLYNAPALRKLSLSDCYVGPAGARHFWRMDSAVRIASWRN